MLNNFTSALTTKELLALDNTASVLGFSNTPSEQSAGIPSIHLDVLGDNTEVVEVFSFKKPVIEQGKDQFCAWRSPHVFSLRISSIGTPFYQS